MTQKQNLETLLANVTAGFWIATAIRHNGKSDFYKTLDGLIDKQLAWEAYNGSLDAALSLHKAVLPEYRWSMYEEDSGEFLAFVTYKKDVSQYQEEWAETPARALLIAIIKALISECDE